jgi:glycosyltransferase involved in cell wall biosynthesis
LKGYNVSLDIYGSGKLEHQLAYEINQLKLNDNIKILSPTKDVFKTLIHYDIFLFSSIFEGFPNVILEAMSVGMPILTSNFSGGSLQNLIKDEYNGFVYESGNILDAIIKVSRLIDDKCLRKKLGNEAILDSSKNSISLISKDWLGFINQIIY